MVEVQPQLQLMAQDWRGHAKDLKLGTMKRAYERLLVKPSCRGRPQCTGDASTMGWPPRTAAAVKWINLSLERYRGQSWGSDTSPLEGPRRSCVISEEAVTLKLPWRPQNVRDARATGYLLRNAANSEWNQPRKSLLQWKKMKNELEICKLLWLQLWRCRVRCLPSWFPVLIQRL